MLEKNSNWLRHGNGNNTDQHIKNLFIQEVASAFMSWVGRLNFRRTQLSEHKLILIFGLWQKPNIVYPSKNQVT